MTIYIHGFGGSGEGVKARLLREYFKSINKPFIAPSLSYVPELAISTLEELIESYSDVTLIGSSLGGYYSIYLSQKYNIKATLLNPSIHPAITLKNSLGFPPNFYDESSFKWSETHIEMLANLKTRAINQELIMLLVQKGDDLLDYKEAVDYLPNSHMIVEDGGSHSFEGIENHFKNIVEFLNNKSE